jgi:hypothetical protein
MAAVVLNGLASYDTDSEFPDYTWNEEIGQPPTVLQPLANQGARVTNHFSLGVHHVGLVVTDDRGDSNAAYTSFEVITPRTAIAQFIETFDDFDDLDVPREWRRPLRAPLRQAAVALAHQRPGLAKKFLKAFQNRAATYGESEPFLGQVFTESAQIIIDGLSR